ncbi:MAG: prolyl oligopeptidase family serine peptidase [Labilithrix sp.]|nr:prolyl oligopeptidase family serine peptidase [Labilithrix sp.]
MTKRMALLVSVAAVLAGCEASDDDPRPRMDTPATAAPTPSSSPEAGPPRESEAPEPATRRVAGPPPPRTVTNEFLDVAGKPRPFVLVVPGTYSPKKTYPLVLVLHGDAQDGAAMRAAFPFDEVSAEAAVVAYPSGWSGWNLYDPPDANEDLTFLVALVGALKARFAIDPARVFGTGFSSGAFMVNQVGCRRPSLFRAIVPHSGGAPSEPQDPAATRWDNSYTRCAGQSLGNGPAVMVIHGMADTDVTYDSGAFTASYWAYIDGCQSTRSTPLAPPPCTLHDGCPTGRPVALCAIPNLGHAVWSEAAKATWQFFSAL